MKVDIKGRRIYPYPAEDIYKLILDLPAIALEFPVIKSVKTPEPGHFLFTFAVDFSMYSGTYEASVYIREQEPPKYLSLQGTHKSRVGRLNINLEALIRPRGETDHELIISGAFEVGGMMRFAGKRVLVNGVEFGLKLMFDFLEGQLLKRDKEV